MRLKDILEITNGKGINIKTLDKKIHKFCIDSRKIGKGDFFVPIVGEKFDGHNFISESIEKGAIGYFTERENLKYPNGILVKNSLEALKKIGSYKRKNLSSTVAITGTAGKTTTKELTNFILSNFFKTYATTGNLNNHIGLPLTLANIDESSEIGIFELGASKIGDIRELIEISNPDIRVLVSVGYAHTEGFKSYEGVLKGKGEIFINSDMNVLPFKLNKYYKLKNCITFGEEIEADIKVSNIKITKDGTSGTVSYKNEKIELKLPLFNKAIFYNISAVAGVLHYLNINPIKPLALLKDFQLPYGRGRLIKLNNFQIIDDSYNANPLSVENAIKTLNMIPTKKILILGDMLELGELSENLHRNIGKLILKTDINTIFLYGNETKYIYDEIKAHKLAYYSDNKEALLKRLLDYLKSDKEYKTILIKGSRGMKMEEYLEHLINF